MTDRIRLDDLTSDQLDALYEQLEAAEETETQRQLATAREAFASATTRAARAEAAIARVRTLESGLWQVDDQRDMKVSAVCHSVANDLRAALDEPAPGPDTTATQATEPCPGFPDRCPNPVDVPAQIPHHGGGIRCGCTNPKES